MVGCNSRLDTIQAAILNVKLTLLDEYIDAATNSCRFLRQGICQSSKNYNSFPGTLFKHVFHQYTLIVEGADRNKLNEFLALRIFHP